jgi:WD40 repeat protein
MVGAAIIATMNPVRRAARRGRAAFASLALAAACARPAPPTATTTPLPDRLPAAATIAPLPTASRTPAPTVTPPPSATAALTATAAAAINASSAVSVTEVARLSTAGGVGRVDQAAWSPDGARLALAGGGGVYLYASEALTVETAVYAGAWATSVDFSPDGATFAVGSVNGLVQLWDAASSQLLLVLTGPGVRVERVLYQPGSQGRVLASLGSDNHAHLWNVGEQAHAAELAAAGAPRGLAFSTDGRLLATAEGGAARLWDAETALEGGPAPEGRFVPAAGGAGPNVTALAFGPAGGRLAVADASGVIVLYHAATGEPALRLERLASPATRLAFSPDGAVLASAHMDDGVRLWDAATGALLRALTGHTGTVTSLAFSPDGARLATAGWDEVTIIWGLP